MSRSDLVVLDGSRFEPGTPEYYATGALHRIVRDEVADDMLRAAPVEVDRLRRFADEYIAPPFESLTRAQLHSAIDGHLSPVPPLLACHREMVERVTHNDLLDHLEATYRQFGGVLAEASDVVGDGGEDLVVRIDHGDTYVHIVEIVRSGDVYELRCEDIEDCTEPGEETSSTIYALLSEAVAGCIDPLRTCVGFHSRVYVAPGALADLLRALRVAIWAPARAAGDRWVRAR